MTKKPIVPLVLLLSVAAAARADDWPQFRGPAGTGVADADAPVPVEWSAARNLAWTSPIPGSGWSQPVIAGDLVFVTTAVSDPAAAKDFASGVADPHTMAGEKVAAPDEKIDWKVLALDLESGAVRWERTTASGKPRHPIHPSSTHANETPATDARAVYAFFGDCGTLAAFDRAGEKLWSREPGAFRRMGNMGSGSSPRLHEGLLYLQSFSEEGAFLACLDTADGKEKWRIRREEPGTCWSTPLVWRSDRRTDLVIGSYKLVTGHDPLTGKEIWRFAGEDLVGIASATAGAERLYFGARNPAGARPMHALAAGAEGDASRSEAWTAPGAAPSMASPLVAGGCIYCVNAGILTCLDAATGKQRYQERLPDFQAAVASPVAVGDKVFIVDETGSAVVLGAGPRFEVLGRSKLEDRFWASPATARGSLLLRGLDRLYCIREVPERPWKAGIARTVITPEEPLWLAGYGHRTHPADGKIHDLWVKALALEDAAGRRAVFIATDTLGSTKEFHEHVCAEVGRRYGLDRSQVAITCSHTHSGPVLRGALLPCYPLGDKDLALIDAYTDRLERKIVECAGEALAHLEPARLSAGEGTCGFAVNRRNNREAEVPKLLEQGTPLQGPVDHTVPVLAVRRVDGTLLGAVFGYACHNTNLDTYVWCGDYAGFAQIAVEKAHPGASALFWIGCGADQNPLPRRSLALCEKYGGQLAAAVEEVLTRPMRSVPPSLRTALEIVDLTFEPAPSRDDLQASLQSKNAVEARWAKGLLARLDRGERFPSTYPFPVQAWRLGDQLWVILGGEVVVDYALRFRTEYGPGTWTAGYANDVMGYIPSERVWKEGGYESGALHEYGMPAHRWAGDVEERVAGTVERVVRRVQERLGTARKELYRARPRPAAAAVTSQTYAGPGLEILEVRSTEATSDVPTEITARLSTDDGRTWSEPWTLPETMQDCKGTAVWEGSGASFFDPEAGVLVEAWLRQIHLSGVHRNFTYVRLSRDHGRTWSAPRQLRYEEGEDFDPQDPVKPGFLTRNEAYFGSNFMRHSSRVLIHAVADARAPGDREPKASPWTGSLCFAGRWDSETKEYRWTAGKPASVSPEVSSRGLMEPEAAELAGGRVLVVWRGSDTPQMPGRKWFSVSEDCGMTLSPVAELKYDDGTRFWSPSSYQRMLRHSVTRKLYWIGNIASVRPRGNWPRYPLVIAEVDEAIPAIRRGTVTTIDDRGPGQSDQVQFSNFSLREDRETHELVLFLTPYGADAKSVFDADSYRYTFRLR